MCNFEMKCLNCGKELSEEEMLSFQIAGRMNIGYDCTCGYTTYPKDYIEKTPPVVDSILDIHNAVLEQGGKSYIFGGPGDEIVLFKIDSLLFLTEILSQCDFDYRAKFKQKGTEIIGNIVCEGKDK